MDLRVGWGGWTGSGARVWRWGFAAILLLVAGSVSAQTVYRWEDERGVVHFSDAPPRDAKNVESRNMPRAPKPAVRGTDDPSAAARGESEDNSKIDPQASATPSAARIEITAKDVIPAGEATNEFSGEVENVGGSPANDIVVIIEVTEPNQGAHCLREEVDVSPSSLDPGEKGSFSVTLSNPCFYGPIDPALRPEWN
jgi:hypothetical protein